MPYLFFDKPLQLPPWLIKNTHNLKGPAIIYASGTQEWYKNGKRHREGDLPAVIYAHGTQEWYVNGKRHREGDLPAIIYDDDSQEWWINGYYIK